MEKILLVEPGYNNKYPPIGLMKISTYFKRKGDYVEFYKGKAPHSLISTMDKVMITSLFTFFFDETVETVKHYQKYIDSDCIYLGGISATLMPDKYYEKTHLKNILKGQLTDSSMLGYNDAVNIDILPLDYDILDDIDYSYGIEDNFFAYATRGCPRKCAFCAVKTLEPQFLYTNHLEKQVSYVRQVYGDKRHIMLMDNNIIYCDNLGQICDDLVELGFGKGNNSYIAPNPAEVFFKKLDRRIAQSNVTWRIIDNFIIFLKGFSKRIKKESLLEWLNKLTKDLDDSDDKQTLILNNRNEIINLVEKYRFKKKLIRFVDFNQGLDARLLTHSKMEQLAKLEIRPFRLAYDDIKETEQYKQAFELAYKYGIRHFSNYMLYNFNDRPEDLWQRAYNNILLYNEYEDIHAFSFPMKYAPIDRTDRAYIGKHWNKKYLSAINIIINVTHGVIARELDFFLRAYGHDPEEFKLILAMPNEFIKYRNFFDDNGLTESWKRCFKRLSEEEKILLLDYVSGDKKEVYKGSDDTILEYYHITKRQVETNKVDIQKYIV